MFRFIKGKKARKTAAKPAAMAAVRANGVNKETAAKIVKARRRTRPGIRAIREIRKYQKTTAPLIEKANFMRVLREILQDVNAERGGSSAMKMTKSAFDAFREGAETYMVEQFQSANNLALYSGRETIMAKDMRMVRALQADTFNHTHASTPLVEDEEEEEDDDDDEDDEDMDAIAAADSIAAMNGSHQGDGAGE